MAKKILIIEDDTFLQGLASRKLGADGYEVEAASSGEESLKKMEKRVPDLILLDLLLPKVDGFEVLRNIRHDPALKDVPVIVFSNLSEEKDIKMAKELGIEEFMIKSNFTLDELAQKIKSVLG